MFLKRNAFNLNKSIALKYQRECKITEFTNKQQTCFVLWKRTLNCTMECHIMCESSRDNLYAGMHEAGTGKIDCRI